MGSDPRPLGDEVSGRITGKSNHPFIPEVVGSYKNTAISRK